MTRTLEGTAEGQRLFDKRDLLLTQFAKWLRWKASAGADLARKAYWKTTDHLFLGAGLSLHLASHLDCSFLFLFGLLCYFQKAVPLSLALFFLTAPQGSPWPSKPHRSCKKPWVADNLVPHPYQLGTHLKL